MAGVDFREMNRNDLGVLIAGAVAFIASFLPYWGISYSVKGFGGFSTTVNAWHGYAVIGLLLIFAGAIIVAVRVFGGTVLPDLGVGWHVIVAALAALGTLLVILRAFTYPHASFAGGSYGVKWGGYILFLAGLAETAFAILGMRESGERIAFERPGGAGSGSSYGSSPAGSTTPAAEPPRMPPAPDTSPSAEPPTTPTNTPPPPTSPPSAPPPMPPGV